jgi:GNAT superfamily N-acetyltransferase
MITIQQASSEEELQEARTLIRAYLDWHRKTYADFLDIIERYFATVESELAELPGPFAPPRGRLLLAYVDGLAAGVVALQEKEQGVCIMQRMFVYPRFQGQGIGRALANRLITEARASGYEYMWLDTAPRQLAAHSLYRSLGFEPIVPYFEIPVDWPEELRKGILFMGLRL